MSYLKIQVHHLVLFLFVLFVSGCGNLIVNPEYKPDLKHKTPLSSVTPMTISVNVEDHRQSENPALLGYTFAQHRNGNKDSINSRDIISTTPVIKVIAGGIRKRLTIDNHKVTTSPDSEHQVSIDVKLLTFWFESRVDSASTTSLITKIKAEVSIKSQKNPKVFATTILVTNFQVPFNFNAASTFENAINDAITEFVRNLSFDPVVIETLSKAGR